MIAGGGQVLSNTPRRVWVTIAALAPKLDADGHVEAYFIEVGLQTVA